MVTNLKDYPIQQFIHLYYPLTLSVGDGTATPVFPVTLFNNAHEDNIMAHTIVTINLFIISPF